MKEKVITVESLPEELRRFGHITPLSKRHRHVQLWVSEENSRKRVIKIIPKTESSLKEQNRIANEARFSFQHQGLPNIVDFIDTPTYLLLVRDYVPGITLDKFWKNIKKKERLATLNHLMNRLVPIFEELRKEKVLHLDIKPSNILVSGNGEDMVLHLIDFGLARFEGEPGQTTTYFPLGYAAPELLLNQLDILNHRTDVFALGVSIWELFEGHLPLMHENPLVMTNLQLNLNLPDGNSLPKELFALILKMTCKYSFPKPPNQMDINVVREHLLQAMNQRVANLGEVQLLLQSIIEQPHWLVKLFSKS
jgi:serine/threonine protein kinase